MPVRVREPRVIPVGITLRERPAEAMPVIRGHLASVVMWLRENDYRVELHLEHGLLIHTDSGLVRADYGQYVTLSRGRVETWDRSELIGESDGLASA